MYPPQSIKISNPPIFESDMNNLYHFMKLPSKEKIIERITEGQNTTSTWTAISGNITEKLYIKESATVSPGLLLWILQNSPKLRSLHWKSNFILIGAIGTK